MIQEDEEFILFSTKGSSMFPFIRWDEHILVKKIPAERMQAGDVIVYRSNQGHTICHRLIKSEQMDGVQRLWTKGDQRRSYDDPVEQEAVLGRVIAVKRKMRLVPIRGRGRKCWLDQVLDRVQLAIFVMKRGGISILRFFSPGGSPKPFWRKKIGARDGR